MSATQSVEVYHFNVGQGDSCLIVVRNSTPNAVASAVLVDSGTKGSWPLIKRYIGEIQQIVGPFTLTAIVVSHYDEDHVGGIVAMLEELKKVEPITTALFRTGTVKTILYDPGPMKLQLESPGSFPADRSPTGEKNAYLQYLDLINDVSGYVSRAMTAAQLDQLQNSPDARTYGPLIGREIFWNESPF